MRLKDLMTQNIEMIDRNSSLAEAAKIMRDKEIGFLPVTENGKVAGLFTDRDIVIRGVAQGCDPENTRVHEVSTYGMVFCYEDQTVEEAARLMGEKQIRRLVIVDRGEHPVGVISLGDLAAQLEGTDIAKKILEKVSQPGVVQDADFHDVHEFKRR